tara:strand:+ start:2579 stop:4036 length:1458 start_codon:yes stop_codon:yes gene_type:complete
MSSLNRRMFQTGGLARGSGMQRTYQQPVETTREFVYNASGGVDFVEKDQDGNILQTIPVDLSLSETRNPAEALQKQRNVDKFNRLQTGLMALPFLKAPGAILKYGGKFIKPVLDKISPLTIRQRNTLAGPGTTATLTNPNQIIGLTETGKNVALGSAGVGGYLGLEALKPGSVDFAGDIAELQKTDNTKNKGKPMGQSMGIEKKEDAKPEKTVIGLKEQPLVSKVVNSPDFFRFINNLSSSLAETGSLALGGAQGASKALDEKLEGVGEVLSVETSDAERNRKVNQEILGNLNEFEQTERNLSRLEYATGLIDEGATGLPGLFGKGWTQFLSLFNANSGKDFSELDSRTQADAILTALRQQDIRNILGESGRTISNLDREIVAEIFGSITITSTPAEIKSKLREIALRYKQGLKRNRNEIIAGMDYFGQTNMPSGVIQGNTEGIRKILNVKNFQDYQAPEYDPSSESYGQYSGGNYTDIDLVEGA